MAEVVGYQGALLYYMVLWFYISKSIYYI